MATASSAGAACNGDGMLTLSRNAGISRRHPADDHLVEEESHGARNRQLRRWDVPVRQSPAPNTTTSPSVR